MNAEIRPVDPCVIGGHELAADGWRMCACARSLPSHVDVPADPAGGEGCGMTWRVCARCEHIDEHHITENDERDEHVNVQVQPGGFLRQDVPAGLGLLNHHEAIQENTMVKRAVIGGDLR